MSTAATEPALLDLVDLAAAIAARRLSSREATRSFLDRIALWQPAVRCFLSIEGEEAMEAASAADAALERGERRGRLHGVPFAHKDMFHERGRLSTGGSLILRNTVATVDSTALKRLRNEGAIRLGTLAMSEFAYNPTGHNAHDGTPGNPWNPAHITGGSSSGSAAAVSARLTPGALGSDTGGSVRMPANFCGVTGLKTTVGRVSRHGAIPLAFSLDTIGPLARSARDCAFMLALIAGADPLDPTAATRTVPDYLAACEQPIRGLRIGVPDNFYVDDLDPETERAFKDAVEAFRREGVELVGVTLPDQRPLSAASQIVLAVEAAAAHRAWFRERPDDYSPQMRARLENGYVVPAVTYLEALRWRGIALAQHMAATAGVDAMITPVSVSPSPTIRESDVGASATAGTVIERVMRFTRPANYLGLPALSLPVGFSAGGLPIGVQLVGHPFAEDVLLRLGAGFQRATDVHRAEPKLPAVG